MKITEEQLKQIIKEELEAVTQEGWFGKKKDKDKKKRDKNVKKAQSSIDAANATLDKFSKYGLEEKAISYDDVQPEYDAILGFIKAEVMTKSGTSSIADALELLMNEFRDGVHQTGD